MVQDIYNVLPAVEKALLDLELSLPQQQPTRTNPQANRQAPASPAAGEDQPMPLSRSWEEVHLPESLVQKSTPLRDVTLPTSTARPGRATPGTLPIFPVNFQGATNGTPKKTLPFGSSVQSTTRPTPPSLSGVGSRMLFGASNAFASPASGIKLPSSNFGTSQGPTPFVSASRQQNAFYQPPVKSNGVKRTLEDESGRSPEHDGMSSGGDSPLSDVRMEPEREKDGEGKTTQPDNPPGEETDEEDTALQYSVFGAKNESPKRNASISKKIRGQNGSFRMDEDEFMENHEPERQKKPTKTRSGRTMRATQKAVAVPSKPPAKKAKQAKGVVRHIPGGLMDEDEDEDEQEDQLTILPTRISRQSSRAGKGKSASVDTTDEMERGVQTRRRSSRLSAAGSSGSIRGASPEAVIGSKTRRAGRPSAASKRKR